MSRMLLVVFALLFVTCSSAEAQILRVRQGGNQRVNQQTCCYSNCQATSPTTFPATQAQMAIQTHTPLRAQTFPVQNAPAFPIQTAQPFPAPLTQTLPVQTHQTHQTQGSFHSSTIPSDYSFQTTGAGGVVTYVNQPSAVSQQASPLVTVESPTGMPQPSQVVSPSNFSYPSPANEVIISTNQSYSAPSSTPQQPNSVSAGEPMETFTIEPLNDDSIAPGASVSPAAPLATSVDSATDQRSVLESDMELDAPESDENN